MRPGETWKIYLRADARFSELKNIFAVIERGNSYPTIIRVKKENRNALNGFIFLNILSSETCSGRAKIALSVSIQDDEGNFSEPAVFTASIREDSFPERPPLDIFQERDLGPVMVRTEGINFGG